MATWRNRIVSEGEEDPWRLLPNPLNWRVHPPLQAEGLADVLDSVGWVDRIIVNQRTGRLVDGHLRVALARARGMPTGPVCYVDLSEDEEKLLLATFDPLTGMAMAEKDTLRALLQEVQTDSAALQELLDMLAAEAGINLETEQPIGEAPDAQMDAAEELREKWGVQSGQLWEIGEHRLICGDCTDKTVVKRVMGGKRAQLVYTDPPYGVDYDGGTKVHEKLAGDTTTDLYAPACQMAAEFSDEKAALYLWHAGIKGIAAAAAAAAAGYEIRCELIWNKNLAQYGALSAQYKQKHEPMYYCYKRGHTPRWFGPTNEITVWDCDRSRFNEFHPTQKPVELAERAMRNSSNAGDIVADWFLGSGATLIACERLGRKCRAVEISPAYCAVAIQRWCDMVGKSPMLVS